MILSYRGLFLEFDTIKTVFPASNLEFSDSKTRVFTERV